MTIYELEFTAVDETGAIYGGVDGGGFFGVAKGDYHARLRVDDNTARVVGAGLEDAPIPVQVSGSSIELAANAIKLTGTLTALGSSTPTLGTDCPAATLTPTWIKVTLNGVPGVIPFYPL